MKINNINTPKINPYNKQLNKIEQSKSVNKPADKVEISSQAKDMQIAKQFNIERQERVKELKVQVENGNYKVNHQEIAKSIKNYYKG
ncbi:flagellar biosynthesis anti-sigma factor FlgM [Bacillus sp. SG-1]|uniref:flagellar biosynthesis anti-sigma factor FlgM n=1 Tax=Bacillus sp. SG-1 TaxID=161544 RepID=UPI0001544BF5|nr:flagellar biosynthesis anti-sigma factor FlgM [Bacillus sp. SG-1]EDL63912.1 anti-sigma factor repressor of sigma-D-dependent transcription [Bacillus sp. SG-1]